MIIVYAAAIALAGLALWWAMTARPPAARTNLFADLAPSEDRPARATGITGAMGRRVRRLMPSSYLTYLDRLLVEAGHPWRLDQPRLLGLKLATALAVFLLVAVLLGQFLIGVVIAAVAFFVFDYLVMTKRDERREAIRSASADTIDQLVVCVESGLGFDAALARVGVSNDGPLAQELQRAVEDMRAGMPRDLALQAMANRTQLPEIRQLVSALVQAQRHGVSLSETLRIHAAEWRDKRQQALEEKAAKLSTKMMFPTVVCFMPVFFVVVLAPALASFRGVI
jgi:tight adherence protein C